MTESLIADGNIQNTESGATEAASEPVAQAADKQPADMQQAQPEAEPKAQAEGEQAEAKTEDKADDKKADDKPKAPEKYEFKDPESGKLSPTVIAKFSELAKELDLPQDAAQKFLDTMAPQIVAAQNEALESAKQEWKTQSTSDKEFGGDNLAENLAVAKKALDTFGTPELRELLNSSGLGNHPEVIRAFYRAGKAISEDTIVPGGLASKGAQSHADRLYGPSKK